MEEKKGGAPSAETAGQKKHPPSKARKLIAGAIGEPDDGWENLAMVGQRILGAHPDFDPRSYGCPNLSTLVEKSGGFEIRKEHSGAVHIRRKAARSKASGGAKKPGA